MLKEAEQIAVLIGVSILLDARSQFLILHEIFPSPALIVGLVLIALPYSLTRTVTNRIAGNASLRSCHSRWVGLDGGQLAGDG